MHKTIHTQETQLIQTNKYALGLGISREKVKERTSDRADSTTYPIATNIFACIQKYETIKQSKRARKKEQIQAKRNRKNTRAEEELSISCVKLKEKQKLEELKLLCCIIDVQQQQQQRESGSRE